MSQFGNLLILHLISKNFIDVIMLILPIPANGQIPGHIKPIDMIDGIPKYIWRKAPFDTLKFEYIAYQSRISCTGNHGNM